VGPGLTLLSEFVTENVGVCGLEAETKNERLNH